MRRIDPETVADMIREAYAEGFKDGREAATTAPLLADDPDELDLHWDDSMTRLEYNKLGNLSEGY